jgi:hypothetical protein
MNDVASTIEYFFWTGEIDGLSFQFSVFSKKQTSWNLKPVSEN